MEKWRITGWVSLALLFVAVSIGVSIGANEEGIRAFVRASAQVSVVLFLLAFSASSLHALLHRGWSAWLLRNRRYIGVSFAVSHSMHFAALLLLAVLFPHPFLDDLSRTTIVGGLLAYLIIMLMAITSFDAPRRSLGTRTWKWLHLIGSYYIWGLFALSYIPRALKDGFYIPFALAIVIVLLLRLFRNMRLNVKPA